MWAVDDEVRTQLEASMKPAEYEYQSPFARKYYGQGKAEGRAEGKADGLRNAIFDVLEARAVACPEPVRQALETCSDLDVLRDWHRRALTAESAEQVVEGGERL
jgi:hypothetical protein